MGRGNSWPCLQALTHGVKSLRGDSRRVASPNLRISKIGEDAQDWRPGIFSAVRGGTGLGGNVYPGLTSWATFSRPCGTEFVSGALTQTPKPVRFRTQSFSAARDARPLSPRAKGIPSTTCRVRVLPPY